MQLNNINGMQVWKFQESMRHHFIKTDQTAVTNKLSTMYYMKMFAEVYLKKIILSKQKGVYQISLQYTNILNEYTAEDKYKSLNELSEDG